MTGRLALQRLFSTFPDGRPGIGLLLLRSAVGGIAITLGFLCISSQIERAGMVWACAGALIAGGLGLVIGFLTPLASLLVAFCVSGIALSWFPGAEPPLLSGHIASLLLVTTAVGIGLLGPGAFSLDGYLFGRREIVIPPRSRE